MYVCMSVPGGTNILTGEGGTNTNTNSLYGMFSVYMASFQFIWHSVYMVCVSIYGMC